MASSRPGETTDMARKNGTWSPIYGQAWSHEKTARAASVVASAGNHRRYAPFLVLGWVNRLNIWCLENHRNGGETATLSDARMGTIAWPEAVEGGMSAAK